MSLYRTQPKLFEDPDSHYPIYDLHLNFAEYIKQCEKIILNTRQDLGTNANTEQIVDANSPFELRPPFVDQKHTPGILLIHGLLDCPFLMRDLANQFHAQGFLVRSLLLPGHGTVPGALLHVKHTQWQQAVRYGVASLKKEVDNVFLAGFSTGASLALLHAAQDATIAGIVMLSPALKIRSRIAFTANWHHAISWLRPVSRWFSVLPEVDYAKYKSVTYNAIYQVYLLGKEIQKQNPALWKNLPIFLAIVSDDSIVCSNASMRLFKLATNTKNRLIYYDHGKMNFTDTRIIQRHVSYPSMRITHFSHVTLPVSPTNPHYGVHSDFLAPTTLDPSDTIYGARNSADEFAYQLLHRFKIMKYSYLRLTFNPDFDFLKDEIIKFIFSAMHS